MSGNENDLGEMIQTSAEMAERAAMPEADSVMCDDNAPQTVEKAPLPAKVAQKPQEQKSPAEWAYERLILYIQKFEEMLDNEHEVVMGFTGSDAGQMRIEGMGFFAPDIVTFYGSDPAGGKTQMVQHVSQLNVMLRAIAKPAAQEEPTRIGFRLGAALADEAPMGEKG